MIGLVVVLLFCTASVTAPAPVHVENPRTIFAKHNPEGRLPNTKIQKLGTVRVKSATYAIHYLDFINPVSGHGLQQIAIIKNGTQFVGGTGFRSRQGSC